MAELNEKELLQLKNRLPRAFAKKIQDKYQEEFGRSIRKSSVYRGLAYKTRSNNIIEIALMIVEEEQEKQQKIKKVLSEIRK
ncbi:MAG: hypothetical protein N4A41_14995 [Crocinitomicaceae bacterium]|nr:hypothetical protein [Crocinitomicaceae bacterium]